MPNNRQLYIFVAKCLALFILWNVAYHTWLQYTNLDNFVTHTTADISTWFFNQIGYVAYNVNLDERPGDSRAYSTIKLVEYDASIGISDSCNALTLIILFVGFIIAYPGDWRYKILFITVGSLIIFIINVIRVQALIFNYIYFPSLFDFNHHVTFTILVYVFVFYFWILWANKFSKKKINFKRLNHAG